MNARNRFFLMLATAVLLCLPKAVAQTHISGVVTDSLGKPIHRAFVMEMNKDHRILNQTTTDRAGHFTMPVRDPKTGNLRITANGYLAARQRLREGQSVFQIKMTERPVSRLSLVLKDSHSKYKVIRSRKLLCGRVGLHTEPWLVSMARLTDSIYSIQMPVRATNAGGIYKEGRMLVFMDENDYHLTLSYNAEDAPAIVGLPDESSLQDQNSLINPDKIMPVRATLTVTNSDAPIYYYPQFLFTYDELQLLLNQSDKLARLAVDTESADNYWLIYPMETFGKELKRILSKLAD